MGGEGHSRAEGQAPANVGSWNGEYPSEPSVDYRAGVSPHPLHWSPEGRVLGTCIFNKLRRQ